MADDMAVVFVPKIIGTELTCQGNLFWPGTWLEMVGPYKYMAQLTSNSSEGQMQEFRTMSENLK